MSLRKQILSYSGVNIINASVPFLLLPILTEYLSPSDYGILSLVQLLMALAFPIVLNAQSLITIEYSNLSINKFKKLISSILFFAFAGFIVLESGFYLLSDYIYEYFFLPDRLLLFIPVFLLFQVIPMLIPFIFQAKKQPFNFGKFKISLTIFNIGLSLFFVMYLNYGWEGRLWGIVGSFAVFNLIGLYLLMKIDLLSFNLDKDSIMQVFRYGIPLIPHMVGVFLISGSSRFFLADIMGVKEVGIFAVAFQVSGSIFIIMNAINLAWSPYLFESLNKNPTMDIKLKLIKQTYQILIFMIIVVLVFLVLCPFIFYVFIDDSYHSGILLSRILAFGFLFQGFYFMFTNYIFYSKKTKYLSFITLFSSFIVVISNFFLISSVGILGAAYAVVISYIVLCLIVAYFANKLVPMPWFLVLKNIYKK
jgi:O-antigen/teichoic acid export membrane protein